MILQELRRLLEWTIELNPDGGTRHTTEGSSFRIGCRLARSSFSPFLSPGFFVPSRQDAATSQMNR